MIRLLSGIVCSHILDGRHRFLGRLVADVEGNVIRLVKANRLKGIPVHLALHLWITGSDIQLFCLAA